MCQDKIITLLKKEGEPLTAKQIREKLKVSNGTLRRSINSLIKFNEISFREISYKEALEKYNCTRRLTLFYLDN